MTECYRQLTLAHAAHLGLRRLVLELHQQQTGAPALETEARLERYIQTELQRLLRQMPADLRAKMQPPKT